MNYLVNINKGLINVNTLSPNQFYFYKLKQAKELNKSAFGCPISFYDVAQNLIYYKKNAFAHELHSAQEEEYYRKMMETNNTDLPIRESRIKLVNWSKQGNWCYFLEYFDRGINSIYESVFLDCQNKTCYRINELNDNGHFVNENNVIDNFFDEGDILEKLHLKGIVSEQSTNDSLKDGLFSNIFSRWYP